MEQRCPGKLASTGGLHGFRSAMQAGFVRAKPEEVKSHDRKTSNSQGCFKKSFPLDHAKISKREIDVRGEIYKLV